jgi:hypothetical protein
VPNLQFGKSPVCGCQTVSLALRIGKYSIKKSYRQQIAKQQAIASGFANHASQITHHKSRITNHASQITHHKSRITNHAS